jgi:hypothetical protein
MAELEETDPAESGASIENTTAISSGRAALEVDLDVWPSLVRFAAVSLVDQTNLRRREIAARLGSSPAAFSGSLLGRNTGQIDDPFYRPFCYNLQRVLHTIPGKRWTESDLESESELRSDRRHVMPMLTTLFEELDESPDPDSGFRIPSAWFPDLCRVGVARSEVEIFARGEALRDMLRLSQGLSHRDYLLVGEIRDHAQRTVKDLLAVAGASSYWAIPSVQILSRLGPYVLPEVEKEITRSPLGFRSIRVLSRMLWHSANGRAAYAQKVERARNDKKPAPRDPQTPDDKVLLRDINEILLGISETPPLDPYPAQGFFVETMRYAPPEWAWVKPALMQRATSRNRPARERMFAGLVAGERGYDDVPRLAAQLRRDGEQLTEPGLAFVADLLIHMVQQDGVGQPRSEQFRKTLRPWLLSRPEATFLEPVQGVLRKYGADHVPPSVREATTLLTIEAIMTPDETRRRRACDVLLAAHLAGPVSDAVSQVVTTDTSNQLPKWTLENATFILGYLQQDRALPVLSAILDQKPHVDIVHAAAWGIGDICAMQPRRVAQGVAPIRQLEKLATGGPGPVAQAATYALAASRHPEIRTTLQDLEDNSEDQLVAALAIWGKWLYKAEEVQSRADVAVRMTGSRTFRYT